MSIVRNFLEPLTHSQRSFKCIFLTVNICYDHGKDTPEVLKVQKLFQVRAKYEI